MFLALKVQLESLVKRELLVLLVSLVTLDVLEPEENVVILEREDQLESRDLKVNHLLHFLLSISRKSLYRWVRYMCSCFHAFRYRRISWSTGS